MRELSDSLRNDTKRSKAAIAKEHIDLIDAICEDDEDESPQYFVSEVKFSEEFGYLVCFFFCVPFDGDAIISKAFAAKAKKENKYTDDCLFDLDYVEGRVRASIVK